MKYFVGLVAAGMALSVLTPVIGQWAIPVVVVVWFVWLFRSRLWGLVVPKLGMPVSTSARTSTPMSELPDPPTKKDYRAAGVDTRTCTKCGNPLKTVGYYFGLAGVATVYCPSCWSKAADPNYMERYDKHFESLTTKYERQKPM